MNNRLMIAILAIGLIVNMAGSAALGADPKYKAVTHLYDNILIGELLPSGNVYLERLALDGGYDNQQRFQGFNYPEQIKIYPLKKAKWDSLAAAFGRLIEATYIGEIEKESQYFNYPFSLSRQDSLLYKVEQKIADAPVTVVAINNYQIEKIIYFDGSAVREYSDIDYKAAMEHIRYDHERKDKYGSVLTKISGENTILNARKLALLRINNVDYDVLLSVYSTHGIEYASIVYVIDFILNGKVVLTKEKFNTDGPY